MRDKLDVSGETIAIAATSIVIELLDELEKIDIISGNKKKKILRRAAERNDGVTYKANIEAAKLIRAVLDKV